MQPVFTFFQLLFLLTALQGVVLSGLLLAKKGKRPSTVLLALLLLVFSLASLKIVLQEQINAFPTRFPMPLLYQFALGPLLYLYVRSSLTEHYAFNARIWWHFLPTLLLDVALPVCQNLWTSSPAGAPVEKFLPLDSLAFLSFTGYGLYTWHWMNAYKRQPGSQQPLRASTQSWLRQMMLASGLINLSWLTYLLLSFTGIYRSWWDYLLPHYPTYLVIGIGVYWIGIKGYLQPQLELITLPAAEKRVLIAPSLLEERKAQLLTAMRQHGYYRNEQLTIGELAQNVELPVKELSYVINTGFGQNFTDFINQLRVEELKQLLTDPKQRQYSILGLATQVGFHSKPSFYRAFKKCTGLTPTQYLERMQRQTSLLKQSRLE